MLQPPRAIPAHPLIFHYKRALTALDIATTELAAEGRFPELRFSGWFPVDSYSECRCAYYRAATDSQLRFLIWLVLTCRMLGLRVTLSCYARALPLPGALHGELMSLKVLFIYPSINLGRFVNYGVACLSGVLAKKGHATVLYHPVRREPQHFAQLVRSQEFDLCLVSSVTNQWPYALEMIRQVREESAMPIILGGHHATSSPHLLAETPELDALCVGEGDLVLAEIADRLVAGRDLSRISGLWTRDSVHPGEVIPSEVANLVEDLDALPLPDFSIFDPQTIANRPSLQLSRGCPYDCSYCCNNNLRRIYAGKGQYVRKKSVERAMQEVRSFVSRYRPAELNFDDDTFVKDKRWLAGFLERYRQEIALPFNCNTRAETVDAELCRLLKRSGCNVVCIGIESGNEEFRRKVYHRNMGDQVIIRAFELLHEHGLSTYAFNIVGAPGETWAHYLDTVALNRRVRATSWQITTFYPFPGSELYNVARENGFLTEGYTDSFVSRSLLKMRQFPVWQIRLAALTFDYRVWSADKGMLQKGRFLVSILRQAVSARLRRKQ